MFESLWQRQMMVDFRFVIPNVFTCPCEEKTSVTEKQNLYIFAFKIEQGNYVQIFKKSPTDFYFYLRSFLNPKMFEFRFLVTDVCFSQGHVDKLAEN